MTISTTVSATMVQSWHVSLVLSSFEQFRELSHDEVHLFGGFVQFILHVVEHPSLGTQFPMNLLGHAVDAVDGAVELLQTLVLLLDGGRHARVGRMNKRRVLHLEVAGRVVRASLGGERGLLVGLDLRARARARDGVPTGSDVALGFVDEGLALVQLRVVDVRERRAVALDVFDR